MKKAASWLLLLLVSPGISWGVTGSLCTVDPGTGLCVAELPPPPSTNPPPPSPPLPSGTGACSAYSGKKLDFCKDALISCASRPDNMPQQTCIDLYVATGMPPPLGTPAPPAVSLVNRGTGWVGIRTNNSLFDAQTTENLQVGSPHGTFVDQADSFNNHSNMLFNCAAINISGRRDTYCAANPNDPECTGMNSALGNAVVCAVYGPPKPDGTRTCLAYGAFGFSLEEWMVFGQQYYDGMGGCMTAKEGNDKADDRRTRMNGLVDIATFGGGPGAPTPGGATGASSITGKTEVTSMADAIIAKFDDGATHLGFERGELVRRAAKGIPFLTTFSESPFAEKISSASKELVEAALGSPAETVERANAKKLAMKDKAAGESGETAVVERTPSSAGDVAGVSSGSGLGSGAGSGAGSGKIILVSDGSPAGSSGTSSPSSSSPSKKTPSRSRDLAAARALLGESTSRSSQPLVGQELTAASPLEDNEPSLFQRVKHSYRRRELQFRNSGESTTARDVRLTEQPEFFKDL